MADGEWCVKKQEKVVWALGDPAEVKTVKSIFEDRIKGGSILSIVKKLNDRGIPCARRGKWKNKDQKWSNGTVKSIIENPAYCGIRVYGRYSSSKIRAQAAGWTSKAHTRNPQWRMDRRSWISTVKAHDPIVTLEQWEKANSSGHTHHMSGKPRCNVPYLLTGIIKCSRCGYSFQGQSTRVRGKNYYRYVCGGYNSKGVCEYCAVNRDDLEEFVVSVLEEILLDNVILEKVESRLRRLLEMHHDDKEQSLKQFDGRLRDLDGAILRLTTAIEQGAPYDMFAQRLRELAQAKEVVLRDRISAAEQVTRCTTVRSTAELVSEFSEHFQEAFKSAPHYLKKEMVGRCVGGIIVDRDSNLVRCYFRRFPMVGGLDPTFLGDLEKRETVPVIAAPFRKVAVPGTGLEPARPHGH